MPFLAFIAVLALIPYAARGAWYLIRATACLVLIAFIVATFGGH